MPPADSGVHSGSSGTLSRRQAAGPARAVGFVASRVLEAATIYLGIVSLMSIVSLRRAGAGTAALMGAQGLAAQYQWTFFFGQSFIPAVNGVLLGSLLYQSRLVPRWLPLLGIHRSGSARRLMARHSGRWDQGNQPSGRGCGAAHRHMGVSLGVHLTFRGFKSSPITAGW
jgi:hypothetical protein